MRCEFLIFWNFLKRGLHAKLNCKRHFYGRYLIVDHPEHVWMCARLCACKAILCHKKKREKNRRILSGNRLNRISLCNEFVWAHRIEILWPFHYFTLNNVNMLRSIFVNSITRISSSSQTLFPRLTDSQSVPLAASLNPFWMASERLFALVKQPIVNSILQFY